MIGLIGGSRDEGFIDMKTTNRCGNFCKTIKNKKVEKATNISYRKIELTHRFLAELDKHINDLKNGKVETSQEINEFAKKLFINPNHLSDTIKEVLGKSPCGIYEEKLAEAAKEMLANPNRSISDIANTLSYDHSNFTKFFKRLTGYTPKEYRNQSLSGIK